MQECRLSQTHKTSERAAVVSSNCTATIFLLVPHVFQTNMCSARITPEPRYSLLANTIRHPQPTTTRFKGADSCMPTPDCTSHSLVFTVNQAACPCKRSSGACLSILSFQTERSWLEQRLQRQQQRKPGRCARDAHFAQATMLARRDGQTRSEREKNSLPGALQYPPPRDRRRLAVPRGSEQWAETEHEQTKEDGTKKEGKSERRRREFLRTGSSWQTL